MDNVTSAMQKQLNRSIKLLSGVGPRNCVLDGNAHGRHLANTVGYEWMWHQGGNAPCSKITLGKFVDFLHKTS